MFEQYILIEREYGIELGQEGTDHSLSRLLEFEVVVIEEPAIHVIEHSRHGTLQVLQVCRVLLGSPDEVGLDLSQCIFKPATGLIPPEQRLQFRVAGYFGASEQVFKGFGGQPPTPVSTESGS